MLTNTYPFVCSSLSFLTWCLCDPDLCVHHHHHSPAHWRTTSIALCWNWMPLLCSSSTLQHSYLCLISYLYPSLYISVILNAPWIPTSQPYGSRLNLEVLRPSSLSTNLFGLGHQMCGISLHLSKPQCAVSEMGLQKIQRVGMCRHYWRYLYGHLVLSPPLSLALVWGQSPWVCGQLWRNRWVSCAHSLYPLIPRFS